MRFLSNSEKRCWSNEALPIRNRIAAIGLLFAAIFVMPVLVNRFLGHRLDVPDILLFSSLPGIIAYGLVPAGSMPLARLSWKGILRTFATLLILLLLVGITTFAWQKLLTFLNIPFEAKQQWLTMIKNYHGGKLVQLYFGLCVLPPLIEELLFRRLIYDALLGFGFVPAFIVTALIFSLCHFFTAGIPGLFILGLGFQYVYLKEKNITAAMLLHFLVNSVSFAASI